MKVRIFCAVTFSALINASQTSTRETSVKTRAILTQGHLNLVERAIVPIPKPVIPKPIEIPPSIPKTGPKPGTPKPIGEVPLSPYHPGSGSSGTKEGYEGLLDVAEKVVDLVKDLLQQDPECDSSPARYLPSFESFTYNCSSCPEVTCRLTQNSTTSLLNTSWQQILRSSWGSCTSGTTASQNGYCNSTLATSCQQVLQKVQTGIKNFAQQECPSYVASSTATNGYNTSYNPPTSGTGLYTNGSHMLSPMNFIWILISTIAIIWMPQLKDFT